MALMDAINLAQYIKYKHNEISHKEISHLKLQKALYFCFGYWGGFVRNGKQSSKLSEIDLSNEDEILFNNRIEAWVYGPVVPDVYRIQDSILPVSEFPINNEIAQNYVDGVLNDVLRASDFRLVEESHEDDAWKNHFDFEELMHSNEIPKEEIIKEYARKQIFSI